MLAKLCHKKPSPKAHGALNAHLHTRPSVLALGHVSKPSLKQEYLRVSAVQSPYQPSRVSKDMTAKGYREDSAQNQVMGFRSGKSFLWVDESTVTEKMRSCTSRTARRAKKP